jgi:hypothetical protein
LLAADTGDDVVTEVSTVASQFLDEGVEVGYLERETVPTSGAGQRASGMA